MHGKICQIIEKRTVFLNENILKKDIEKKNLDVIENLESVMHQLIVNTHN